MNNDIETFDIAFLTILCNVADKNRIASFVMGDLLEKYGRGKKNAFKASLTKLEINGFIRFLGTVNNKIQIVYICDFEEDLTELIDPKNEVVFECQITKNITTSD